MKCNVPFDFRVWDEDEKKFHYFTQNSLITYQKIWQKHVVNGDQAEFFTGALDKRGDKIYQGTRIRAVSFSGTFIFNAVIEYNPDIAAFEIVLDNGFRQAMCGWNSIDIYIIGNIHEGDVK